MLKKIMKVVNRSEEILVVVITIAMLLVVTWSVICRRFLGIPFLIGEELSRYLMIYAVFIGIPMGVRMNSHIGIHAIVEALPAKAAFAVDCIKYILLLATYIVLTVISVMMVSHFSMTGQVSTMMRIPMAIVYIILPIGFFFSTVHTIEEFVRELRNKKEKNELEGGGRQ